MLKAAFIFVAEGADSKKDRSIVKTPGVELITIGVLNYEDAVAVTKELAADGYAAIELCGGFGHAGVAKVVEAAQGKLAVGVVRFDNHPGLGGKSGDQLY